MANGADINKRLKQVRRHCMVVHAYYPLGETRVEREAMALIDQGIQVDVISLRKIGEPALERVDGIEVHRLPISRHKGSGIFVQLLEYLSFFFAAAARLTRLYWRRRYDVVQVHNLPDFLVFAAFIPKLMGARVILDIHDLMPEFFAERFQSPMESFKVRIIRWQEQASCYFADYVITVTNLWRERLIQRGVRPEKVGVVMNLADERYFRPKSLDLLPPRTSNRFTLIYHGSFKQNYGLDLLIRSIKIAREHIPDLLLILQGGGPYTENMNTLINELNLSENVQINHNILSAADLPAVIYKADIGVVPNYEDVFTGELLPTKLLEYVALGMPVIAARTRVISSYFDDSQLRFFTPGDEHSLATAIVEAYLHRGELPAQVQKLQRFNSRYNWASMSAHYVEIVNQLSNKSRQALIAEQTQPQESNSAEHNS